MTTSCSSLHLGPPSSNIVDQVKIPVRILTANENQHLYLRIKIIPTATPYDQLLSRIALHFTPPDNSPELFPIQHYDLQIQVSEVFHHNPESNVLLITNSETPAEEVTRWKSLVCDGLKLKMDTCNVSLEGHFDVMTGSEDIAGQNLFSLYKGKTIIMLGNEFPYFERDQRCALDLVDEKDLSPAMINGTSLLVSNPARTELECHVPRLLLASSFPKTREFKTIKKLVAAIANSRKSNDFFETKFICLPKHIGDESKRCLQKANRAATELAKRVPHLRFVISTTPASAFNPRLPGRAGKVEVLPCIPYSNSKMFFTLDSTGSNRFVEINTFGILLSLPLSIRLKMLWDELENNTPNKILLDVIEYDLIIEIKRFSNPQGPWPDSISSDKMLSHLNRLEAFLSYDPSRQFGRLTIDRMTSLLSNLKSLADCCVGSWPLLLTFGTRRKALCSALTNRIDTFFNHHYVHLRDKSVSRQYSKYVAEQTKKLRLIDLLDRKMALLRQIVAKMEVSVQNINGFDVFDVELMGNYSIGMKEQRFHMSQKSRLKDDLAHAKDEVARMS
jgi:hypothetical protein